MSDLNYRSNSDKTRTETKKKKFESVVTGTVKKEEAPAEKSFFKTFVQEELPNIGRYIVKDLLIPTLLDVIEDSVHVMLRGTSSKRRPYGSRSVSYRERSLSGVYRSDRTERRRERSVPKDIYEFEKVHFMTRDDAERVLSIMQESLDTYDVVSVSDFYDLAGLPVLSNTATLYGWTNLDNATIRRDRDGDDFIICLPPVRPL